MSYVNVVVVQDDNVYFVTMHYRSLERFLQRGDSILPSLKPRFLDAGYVVVDWNKKTIINGQSAVPLARLLGKKQFYVVEM